MAKESCKINTIEYWFTTSVLLQFHVLLLNLSIFPLFDSHNHHRRTRQSVCLKKEFSQCSAFYSTWWKLYWSSSCDTTKYDIFDGVFTVVQRLLNDGYFDIQWEYEMLRLILILFFWCLIVMSSKIQWVLKWNGVLEMLKVSNASFSPTYFVLLFNIWDFSCCVDLGFYSQKFVVRAKVFNNLTFK